MTVNYYYSEIVRTFVVTLLGLLWYGLVRFGS